MTAASPNELQQALHNLHAFQLNGSWRLLDLEYKKWLTKILLASLQAEGIPLDKVPLKRALELINEDSKQPEELVPRQVIESLLVTFSVSDSTEETYNLNTTKISRFFARYLFETGDRVWSKDSFLSQWRALASDLPVDDSLLAGLAIEEVDATHGQLHVRYFPRSLLLSIAQGDPRKRFEVLFAIKKKWLKNELVPYVSDLVCSTGQLSDEDVVDPEQIKSHSVALESLMLKYARFCKASGEEYYTNRLPISREVLSLVT